MIDILIRPSSTCSTSSNVETRSPDIKQAHHALSNLKTALNVRPLGPTYKVLLPVENYNYEYTSIPSPANTFWQQEQFRTLLLSDSPNHQNGPRCCGPPPVVRTLYIILEALVVHFYEGGPGVLRSEAKVTQTRRAVRTLQHLPSSAYHRK